MVEQLNRNQHVGGSSPLAGSKKPLSKLAIRASFISLSFGLMYDFFEHFSGLWLLSLLVKLTEYALIPVIADGNHRNDFQIVRNRKLHKC